MARFKNRIASIGLALWGLIVFSVLYPFKWYFEKNLVLHLDTAFQTMYSQEFIAGFEQHVSIIRDTVTTEGTRTGNQYVFLVVDSGGAEAVTRGVNGLIPSRADNNNQLTATLSEWHDLVRKSGFNIFASQGPQRAIMQMTTTAVLNRKIDNQIITELNTGTVTVGGTTEIPSVVTYMKCVVKLQNAGVPWDSNITALVQPAFLAYLEQAPEFSSADYVEVRPFAGSTASWRDKPMGYRWRNSLIITHPNLPGKGTSSEKNFVYHKSAIGHAADVSGLNTEVGMNGEQLYSWARASMYMGAKLLQNAGVVVVTADGSAYA